MINIIEFSLVE